MLQRVWCQSIFGVLLLWSACVGGTEPEVDDDLRAVMDRYAERYSLTAMSMDTDGIVSAVYSARHRPASEIVEQAGREARSSKTRIIVDDTVNRIFLASSPDEFVETVKAWYAADRPPPGIRLTCDILKINLSRDPRIALASEAWKEIAENQQRPETPSASHHLQGIQSQAFIEYVVYLVQTGLAEVITRQVAWATDGQPLRFTAIHVPGTLGTNTAVQSGQPSSGIVLTITPIRSGEQIQLRIDTVVHTDGERPLWFGNRSMASTNSVILAAADNELCSVIGLRQTEEQLVRTRSRFSWLPLIGDWGAEDGVRTHMYEYILMIRPELEE